jgi:hypothetical protein
MHNVTAAADGLAVERDTIHSFEYTCLGYDDTIGAVNKEHGRRGSHDFYCIGLFFSGRVCISDEASRHTSASGDVSPARPDVNVDQQSRSQCFRAVVSFQNFYRFVGRI